MKSLFYSIIGLLIIAMTSCASVSNVSVNNANEPGALQSASFIYALPQTVLDIEVTSEVTDIIPGPYGKYAEKYLGIHQVPVKAETLYTINSIRLKKHLEADADLIYTVHGISNPDNSPVLSNFLRDSMILAAQYFSANQVYSYRYPTHSNELLYTDLSIKRNFEAEKDMSVSMIMPDTLYNSQPTKRNALKEKTLEQKAEEAANFLIKLKKRRFNLVGGLNEYMPDGEAVADALKELARIEEEYLSLFIGKRIVTQGIRNYHYTPLAGIKSSSRIVLFRFDSNEGFVDARETNGIPVMLEMEAMNKIRELENYKQPFKTTMNILPYRIADQVNIRLLAGEQVWAEAMYPVFQYGVMVTTNMGNSK